MDPLYPEITVRLTGIDGNVFVILRRSPASYAGSQPS